MIPWEELTIKLDELDVVRAQVSEARAQQRTVSFFEILLARNTVSERIPVGDAVQLGSGWCIVHWKFPERRGVALYESIALLGIAMHRDGEFLLSLVDTSEARHPSVKHATARDRLNASERHVLLGISRGHSNTEIADQLGLSIHTVKNVAGTAFKKLDVHTRTQAALIARDLDLSDPVLD